MPVSQDASPAPTDSWTRQRVTAMAGSILLITLIAYEQVAVSAAMPSVARHLGGLSLYGVAFAVPLAATVLSMALAGPWADAKGPAPVLWTGTSMFAAGLVVAGLAPSMPALIAGRTVQALGGGLAIVALYVLVARVFTPRQVPKVFVGNSVGWVAPALFGPGISALLVTHGLWRWVFFSAAILAVPAIGMLTPVLRGLPPRRPGSSRSRFRLLPAIGAATGACLMSLSADRPAAVTAAFIVGGVVLLLVSAPRLMPAGTYTGARGLPAVVMTRGLMGAAFAATDVYLPLALTTVHGLPPSQAGWTLTAGGLSWSVTSWFAGRIRTDRGRRRGAQSCMVGLAIGIGLCLVASFPAAPVFLMYLGWIVGGAAVGIGYAPLAVLLLRWSGEEEGRYSSALQANEAVTTAVALAITSTLYATVHAGRASDVALVLVLAVPLAVAILGWAWSLRLGSPPGAAETPARAAGTIEEAAGRAAQ